MKKDEAKTQGLTFCADDLGASLGVNQGIFEACNQGPVRRASVLPTGYALAEAAEALPTLTHPLEVGLHFCLTAGSPLTPGGRTLAEKGVFPPPKALLRRAFMGLLDPGAIREELEGQWEHLQKYGFPLQFIDGHHHAHLFPDVNKVIVDFLLQKEVPRIRLIAEPLFSPPRRRLLERAVLGHLARRTVGLLKRRGYLQQERSRGLGLWQHQRFPEAIREMVASLPKGVWEICVHPRYLDSDFEKLDPEENKGPDPGPKELAALTDPELNRWLTEKLSS